LTNQTKSIFKLIRPFDRSSQLSSPASFSVFYEQSHMPVFRYLYGLTGGPQEDVEDLTAETFTRAWRARRTFEGNKEAALGWLMKIAHRLVIDDFRRRNARPVIEGEILENFPAAYPHPEEATMMGEKQDLLWSLLRSLSDEAREMLVLRYLLDWRVNQIATYLEIPVNTVSVNIHRTLDQLRHQWPQSQED
jgi:RNA polymerase sigma-70 factor, ECF subfamily